MQVDRRLSRKFVWQRLVEHAYEVKATLALTDAVTDVSRCDGLCVEYDGIILDMTRQRLTTRTLDFLFGKQHLHHCHSCPSPLSLSLSLSLSLFLSHSVTFAVR